MENILDKESVQRVNKVLKDFDSNLKIQILDRSARTAIDAANSLSCEVGAIVKSLLLRSDDNFILCLVSGDKRCSLNKIKKIINKKDVSMANAEQVKKITGYTIGGVSPVAHANSPTRIFIDKNLNKFDLIYAAAGHPYVVFEITFDSLCSITKGEISDIVE